MMDKSKWSDLESRLKDEFGADDTVLSFIRQHVREMPVVSEDLGSELPPTLTASQRALKFRAPSTSDRFYVVTSEKWSNCLLDLRGLMLKLTTPK